MSRHTEETRIMDKNIGRAIQSMRIAQGLSRQQLSEKIGVSHQQFYKYETGDNRISVSRMALLSKALKTPLSHFVEVVEEDKTEHRRLTIEVSRMFAKITNPKHQEAVASLIRALSNN